jgi:hypothetical protein
MFNLQLSSPFAPSVVEETPGSHRRLQLVPNCSNTTECQLNTDIMRCTGLLGQANVLPGKFRQMDDPIQSGPVDELSQLFVGAAAELHEDNSSYVCKVCNCTGPQAFLAEKYPSFPLRVAAEMLIEGNVFWVVLIGLILLFLSKLLQCLKPSWAETCSGAAEIVVSEDNMEGGATNDIGNKLQDRGSEATEDKMDERAEEPTQEEPTQEESVQEGTENTTKAQGKKEKKPSLRYLKVRFQKQDSVCSKVAWAVFDPFTTKLMLYLWLATWMGLTQSSLIGE